MKKLKIKYLINLIDKKLIAITLVTFFILIFLMVFLSWQSKHLVKFVPISTDIKYGDKAFHHFLSKKNLSINIQASNELKKLTQILFNFHSMLKWDVFVVNSNIKNAISFPDGKIIIFSSLIDELKSSDELIGILSHEIGHIVLRHGIKSMSQSITTLIFTIFFSDKDPHLQKWVTKRAIDSLARGIFNQEQEYEADKWAVEFLNKNKLNSSGLSNFLKRINTSRKNRSFIYEWTSSHPHSKNRVQKLTNLENKIDMSKTEFDLGHLQSFL